MKEKWAEQKGRKVVRSKCKAEHGKKDGTHPVVELSSQAWIDVCDQPLI